MFHAKTWYWNYMSRGVGEGVKQILTVTKRQHIAHFRFSIHANEIKLLQRTVKKLLTDINPVWCFCDLFVICL